MFITKKISFIVLYLIFNLFLTVRIIQTVLHKSSKTLEQKV